MQPSFWDVGPDGELEAKTIMEEGASEEHFRN